MALLSPEDYANSNKLSYSEVIEMLDAGKLDGQKKDGSWYVEAGNHKLLEDNIKKNLSIDKPKAGTALTALLTFLALIALVGGITGFVINWPKNSEDISVSIFWLSGGVLQFAFLAAIGAGLKYLHQIAINTER